MAELKADVKKQLGIEKQREEDRRYETDILRKISDKTTVAIPDAVVDEQVMRLEQDEKQNLVYRGQTWEEHLSAEGVTEEEHRQRNRKDAEEQVKIGIVLGAIGDKENIEVTPEELEIRMALLRGQYTDPQMAEELNKPEAAQDITARLRSEKSWRNWLSMPNSNFEKPTLSLVDAMFPIEGDALEQFDSLASRHSNVDVIASEIADSYLEANDFSDIEQAD